MHTTGALTATLFPVEPTGTAIDNSLSVIDSTDWGAFDPAVGVPTSWSDFHDLEYRDTVGS